MAMPLSPPSSPDRIPSPSSTPSPKRKRAPVMAYVWIITLPKPFDTHIRACDINNQRYIALPDFRLAARIPSTKQVGNKTVDQQKIMVQDIVPTHSRSALMKEINTRNQSCYFVPLVPLSNYIEERHKAAYHGTNKDRTELMDSVCKLCIEYNKPPEFVISAPSITLPYSTAAATTTSPTTIIIKDSKEPISPSMPPLIPSSPLQTPPHPPALSLTPGPSVPYCKSIACKWHRIYPHLWCDIPSSSAVVPPARYILRDWKTTTTEEENEADPNSLTNKSDQLLELSAIVYNMIVNSPPELQAIRVKRQLLEEKQQQQHHQASSSPAASSSSSSSSSQLTGIKRNFGSINTVDSTVSLSSSSFAKRRLVMTS